MNIQTLKSVEPFLLGGGLSGGAVRLAAPPPLGRLMGGHAPLGQPGAPALCERALEGDAEGAGEGEVADGGGGLAPIHIVQGGPLLGDDAEG